MHGKNCPSAWDVTSSIEKTTTVERFYNHITSYETCFEYDINTPTYNNWTPLHYAYTQDNISLVKALIEMTQSGDNESLDDALMAECPAKAPVELLEKLAKYFEVECEDLTCTFNWSMNARNFEQAIAKMNEGFVNLTDAITVSTWTRIMAEEGNFGMVKELVSHGGLIRECDGTSTIMAAREAKQPEIANWLEAIQMARFRRLKTCVLSEKYGTTLMLGFFADKGSVFHKELANFSPNIVPHIFSFFARAQLKNIPDPQPVLEVLEDNMELG